MVVFGPFPWVRGRQGLGSSQELQSIACEGIQRVQIMLGGLVGGEEV